MRAAMNRRAFFLKTLQATAAGILVPEHLLKGRSMVSLCGIVDPEFWGTSALARQQLIDLMLVANEYRSEQLHKFAPYKDFYGPPFVVMKDWRQ